MLIAIALAWYSLRSVLKLDEDFKPLLHFKETISQKAVTNSH